MKKINTLFLIICSIICLSLSLSACVPTKFPQNDDKEYKFSKYFDISVENKYLSTDCYNRYIFVSKINDYNPYRYWIGEIKEIKNIKIRQIKEFNEYSLDTDLKNLQEADLRVGWYKSYKESNKTIIEETLGTEADPGDYKALEDIGSGPKNFYYINEIIDENKIEIVMNVKFGNFLITALEDDNGMHYLGLILYSTQDNLSKFVSVDFSEATVVFR